MEQPLGQRKSIQWILNRLGYYGSDYDGLWGSGTLFGLENFYRNEYINFFGAESIADEEKAKELLTTLYFEFGGEDASCSGCNEQEPSDRSSRDISEACSGYTTVSGVCWALSRDELMTSLGYQGFQCRPAGVFSLTKNPEFVCANTTNDAGALIYPKSVAFDCKNFNSCGYNVSQTAQMIIDGGLVDEMAPSFEANPDGSITETYCGMTTDGQQICVTNFPILLSMQRPVFVILDGQNFGQGAVSFQ